MNTKCEKCVFAVVDDNQSQTGCRFDIPQTIITQYSSIYNPETTIVKRNGFWKLMNFTCPLALTEQSKDFLLNNGIEQEQVGNTMLNLTKNKYYLIYFLDDDLTNLDTNLSQLNNHFCVPSFISFIKKTKSYPTKDIIEYLNKYTLPSWKLHDIIEKDRADSEIIDMVLDTNLGASGTMSLSIWYNQHYLPSEYFDKINETMNYFLNKPAYVGSCIANSFNGLFIPFSDYLNHHKKINFTLQSLQEDPSVHKLHVI